MRTATVIVIVMVGLFGGCASSEQQALVDLREFGRAYSTTAEWETRAAALRRGILAGANLDPLPRRTPLNAVLHGRQVRDGYSVENVYFESLPGVYVTGNLYRPLGRGAGPFPAVLNPHGHFEEPGWSPRTRPDMQARCVTLARMGAVAFAWDMMGMGESRQVSHYDPIVQTMNLWNAVRALDFVASLPDVDPERIAVTGASGGGSQTILLAAVDGRIAVSVPVAMVSAHFQGGCTCESLLPIREQPATNNAEIAALAAPRPQLIISDGGDWTENTPGVEFPYIWGVYRLYAAKQDVQNAHLAYEGHDYGASKRAALYAFLADHLALDSVPDTAAREPHESLLAFGQGHPRPANALLSWTSVLAALRVAQAGQ